MRQKIDAEKAIRLIAIREGKMVEYIRKQMKTAMLEGINSEDPGIRAYWKKIPRKGDLPTPEELITYLAGSIKSEGL